MTTSTGCQQLEAVIAEMDEGLEAWLADMPNVSAAEAGTMAGISLCVKDWRDRLALLLAEAQLQDQETKDVTTRMGRLSTSSDASRTAATDVAEGAHSMSPDQGRNEPDDDYPYDDEDPYCHRCDNKGFIIVCVDDMCRGAGECMHGDGEIVCPDCKGESAW